MNILDKIVATKRSEVAQAKTHTTLDELARSEFFQRPTVSLRQAIQNSPLPAIISEFKRQSPSKGIINAQVSPESVTSGYVQAGAVGLSVLTDREYFGGSFEDFLLARRANPFTPMLRKDFIVDEYQLFEARAIGADVILLIAACLSGTEVMSLSQKAHELGLEVLLEVHDGEELDQSLCDSVDMVGVNNRNLKSFTTSVETSHQLAERIPDRFVKISESGLQDAETIVQLYRSGYQAFLIGETFMKTPEPARALADLQQNLQRILNHNPLVV
jgi:indole-3-glycerol phosphate synthase